MFISHTSNLPSGKRLHNHGKSPFFMGKSTISMAIFNSHVKLPEGKSQLKSTALEQRLTLDTALPKPLVLAVYQTSHWASRLRAACHKHRSRE